MSLAARGRPPATNETARTPPSKSVVLPPRSGLPSRERVSFRPNGAARRRLRGADAAATRFFARRAGGVPTSWTTPMRGRRRPSVSCRRCRSTPTAAYSPCGGAAPPHGGRRGLRAWAKGARRGGEVGAVECIYSHVRLWLLVWLCVCLCGTRGRGSSGSRRSARQTRPASTPSRTALRSQT